MKVTHDMAAMNSLLVATCFWSPLLFFMQIDHCNSGKTNYWRRHGFQTVRRWPSIVRATAATRMAMCLCVLGDMILKCERKIQPFSNVCSQQQFLFCNLGIQNAIDILLIQSTAFWWYQFEVQQLSNDRDSCPQNFRSLYIPCLDLLDILISRIDR